MNKRQLLGNIVSYLPIGLYLIYTFSTSEKNSGIDWTKIIVAAVIAMISTSIGNRIKNKGNVE